MFITNILSLIDLQKEADDLGLTVNEESDEVHAEHQTEGTLTLFVYEIMHVLMNAFITYMSMYVFSYVTLYIHI